MPGAGRAAGTAGKVIATTGRQSSRGISKQLTRQAIKQMTPKVRKTITKKIRPGANLHRSTHKSTVKQHHGSAMEYHKKYLNHGDVARSKGYYDMHPSNQPRRFSTGNVGKNRHPEYKHGSSYRRHSNEPRNGKSMQHQNKRVPAEAREVTRQIRYNANPNNPPIKGQKPLKKFRNREGNIYNKNKRGNVEYYEADVDVGKIDLNENRGQNRSVVEVTYDKHGNPVKTRNFYSNSHYGNGADANNRPPFMPHGNR